jgi:excisionase family DNA binding protein
MERAAKKQLLTVKEAAEFLGTSAITIRRRVNEGVLPSVQLKRPKGHIRIPQKALDEFISLAFDKSSETLSKKVHDKIPGRPSKFRPDGTLSNNETEGEE